jgi:phosphoribosylformylglycinamidine synthase
MKFGVVVFPGSNCDHDCYHVAKHVLGESAEYIWHKDTDLSGVDCLILPGGFSYGDYLRSGAIAKFSPVMASIEKYARKGGLVLGICNGFQILLEIGLLPGAMLRNKHLKFICDDVHLKVERNDTPFTCACGRGDVLRIPIAHFEGNYFAMDDTIGELERENRVVFRYAGEDGRLSPEHNPNGALNHIAGICSSGMNVLGMMPHPERCAEDILGNRDGMKIFESIVRWTGEGR